MALVRIVALTVAHLGAAAVAAAESDLVAGLPPRLARYYARYLPLVLARSPDTLMYTSLRWAGLAHADRCRPGVPLFPGSGGARPEHATSARLPRSQLITHHVPVLY